MMDHARPLSDTELTQIYDLLYRSCKPVEHALDVLGLDVSPAAVEDQLIDAELQRCEECGWWYQSSNLMLVPSGHLVCKDC